MLGALVLSLVVAAERRSPPLAFPSRAAPVGVAAAPGTFDVVMADGETFIVWADQRRAEGLLTATALTSPSPELWLRVLDGGFLPVCPGEPVASARLAVTPSGRVAIAFRRVDDTLNLTVFDTRAQRFESAGSCGLRVSGSTAGRPALLARGENLSVAYESDGGIWRFIAATTGVRPPARQLNLPDDCSQPVLANADAGVVEGGLCPAAMGPIQLMPVAGPPDEATAFSLVPEAPLPTVVRVDALGEVFLHDLSGRSPVRVSRSVAGQQPFAGQGAVLGFETPDASTEVWSGNSSASFEGRIVGLGVSRPAGIVATQHSNGVVRGTGFLFTPASIRALPASEVLTTATLLQRRPSVVWWDEFQRWLVMWEEAESPSTWRPRAAVVGADWSVDRIPLAAQTLVEWPRVARRPDGGLVAYGSTGASTPLFERVDGGLEPLGALGLVARNVVPGLGSFFAWSDPDSNNNHLETVTYRRPNPVFLASTVSCAAWTSTDGGAFIITRDTDAGAFVERILELQQPRGLHERLAAGASTGCVASRPGQETDVAFAYTVPGGIIVEGREQPRFFTNTVSAANVSGLQLAAYGTDGWVVAWRGDGGVFAAVVDRTTRTLRLDEAGIAHSVPTIAASPHGGVAVAWASLIEDSVEVRLVVIEPANDGGVDAGVLDGGPSLDAGVADAGVDGGAAGSVEFVPVCGCQVSSPSLLLVLIALLAFPVQRLGRPKRKPCVRLT